MYEKCRYAAVPTWHSGRAAWLSRGWSQLNVTGAQILIIAANMKYNGIQFTEISFSVELDAAEAQRWPNAVFLFRAFTSSRLLAFCERTFLRTPYCYGDCRISTSHPISIQLSQQGEPIFHVTMGNVSSTESRAPARGAIESWEGPIYIPGKKGASSNGGHVFFGRLNGHTMTYPFRTDLDSLSIAPASGIEILQALIDSGFAAEEWIVRADATHARSMTYKRSSMPAR